MIFTRILHLSSRSNFTEQQPEVVENDYRVLGTLDKLAWIQGTQQQMTMEEMLEALHDFKEVQVLSKASFSGRIS
jgi:hypothetical protein